MKDISWVLSVGLPAALALGVCPDWATMRDVDAVIRADGAEARREAMRHGGFQHALSDTFVRVEESGEMRTVFRDVLEIGSESGLDRVGELRVVHVPDRESVVVLHLRRRGAPGEPWEDLPFGTALESAGKVDGMYVDERTVAIIPEGLAVGDTVDFAYMIVGESPAGDFEWEETDAVDSRIADRRVVIDLPGGVAPVISAHGFEPPREVENAGRIRLEWSARNIEPAALEGWLPASFEPLRTMRVSTAKSFEDLGSRYRRDLAALSDDEDAVSLAKELLLEGGDPLLVLSTWVQEHIRYVGLEIAAHRLLPAAPDVTLARGYGDCKDMSALLAAMLRSAGLEAWTAFARTEGKGPVDPAVPMLSAFNHEIVAVRRAGLWVFVDPTFKEAVPPWSGAVRKGDRLLVADGRTGLVEARPQPDALDEIRSHAVLGDARCEGGAAGCLSLDVETRYAGPALADMRALLLDGKSDDLERDAADYFRGAAPGRALLGMRRDYSAASERTTPLVIRERFELGPKSRADVCFLRYTPPEIASWFDLPPVSGRRSPLGLGHPRRVEVELEIRGVPSGFTVPAAWSYRDRRIRFERRAERLSGGGVRAHWIAETLEDEVPLSEVTAFAVRLGHAEKEMELALCPEALVARGQERKDRSRTAIPLWGALVAAFVGLSAGVAIGVFLRSPRRS